MSVLAAFILSLFILFIVFDMLRRKKIREKYAALWLLVGLAMLVLAVFPRLLEFVAEILNVQVPSNLLFAMSIVLALGVVYYVHVAYFRVDVVFYSAILDGVIAAALAAVPLFAARRFTVLNGFEKLQLVCIWLLAGYAFAISVPAVIDRSLSLYILEKLQQRGGGIQLARFEEVFTREYVREHRLLDVRLTEQQQSGTIVIADGCVKLTERGQRLASFGRFFRKHLLPKQRLLMGEYSDDLTDPFRNSGSPPDYGCR